jgi:hypothetical protein
MGSKSYANSGSNRATGCAADGSEHGGGCRLLQRSLSYC